MTPDIPINLPAVLIEERKGEPGAVLVAHSDDLVFHAGSQVEVVVGGCRGRQPTLAARRQVPLWTNLPLYGGQAPLRRPDEPAPD